MITDAIRLAQTEHVVYYLLTAYVETLGCAERYGIPQQVTRLPINGVADVSARSRVLRSALRRPVCCKAAMTPVIEEVADVFNVAFERLEKL